MKKKGGSERKRCKNRGKMAKAKRVNALHFKVRRNAIFKCGFKRRELKVGNLKRGEFNFQRICIDEGRW